MNHVFKLGGAWKAKDGTAYTIKAVQHHEVNEYLNDGWYISLADAMAIVPNDAPEEDSDYEAGLREEIKCLGGKPGGRSSIATLEKQLAELKK